MAHNAQTWSPWLPQCPACSDPVQPTEHFVATPACPHIFHELCIVQLHQLGLPCPFCVASAFTPSPSQAPVITGYSHSGSQAPAPTPTNPNPPSPHNNLAPAHNDDSPWTPALVTPTPPSWREDFVVSPVATHPPARPTTSAPTTPVATTPRARPADSMRQHAHDDTSPAVAARTAGSLAAAVSDLRDATDALRSLFTGMVARRAAVGEHNAEQEPETERGTAASSEADDAELDALFAAAMSIRGDGSQRPIVVERARAPYSFAPSSSHGRGCTATGSGAAGQEGRKTEAAPECAICLEPLQGGDDVQALACMDVFHKSCVQEWLRERSECPCCRMAVAADVRADVLGGTDE